MMAEAEEAVGEFYRACANVPEEDRSFWLQAAGEEDTHKKSVQKMEEMISRNLENFSLHRPFNPFEDPDPGEARNFCCSLRPSEIRFERLMVFTLHPSAVRLLIFKI